MSNMQWCVSCCVGALPQVVGTAPMAGMKHTVTAWTFVVQVDAAVAEDRDCVQWAVTAVSSQLRANSRDSQTAALTTATHSAVSSSAKTDAAAASVTRPSPEDERDTGGYQADDEASLEASDVAGRISGGDVSSVRLLVGVLTGGRNRARRDAVRQTWGADPRCVVQSLVQAPVRTQACEHREWTAGYSEGHIATE